MMTKISGKPHVLLGGPTQLYPPMTWEHYQKILAALDAMRLNQKLDHCKKDRIRARELAFQRSL